MVAKFLKCMRCSYEWRTLFAQGLPKCCPACKSRNWQKKREPRVAATVK